jgi:transcriptional regulator with XRE-family HTH domain
MAEANPTVRQRELGARLRALRTGLGLTVDDVAGQVLFSATKVSRIETASRRALPRDVRDLCRMYGVSDEETAELMNLARQAREPGWWTQYDDLKLSPYIGLEQEAAAITSFAMYFVPPLMQTENYARAIIRGIDRRIYTRILDDRVEARLRRQELLTRDQPPRYRALLDEAVLHREVGGKAVLHEQLDKILKLSGDGLATVQIIPFDAGAYGSADSNFDLLEFDGPVLQPLVFVEGLVTHLYLERPEEIRRYREALEYLRDAALSPRDSRALIARVNEKYENVGSPDPATNRT